jgi:hypothetical protein
MLRQTSRTFGLFATVASTLALFAGAAVAQTKTTTQQVKTFEVVSVDGNVVVVKGEDGAKEFTVPEDFRFTVNGKKVPVSELKPGMKGTATITTTTTVRPVYVTEVKAGQVMRTLGTSVIVRGTDGIHMYSQGDIDKRNIRIVKDGRPVQLAELHEGDKLTATIVTEGAPKVMTEKDVEATLSGAAPSVAAAAAAGSPSSASTPASAPKATTATTTPAAPAAGTAGGTGDEGSGTASESRRTLMWILAAVVVLVVGFLLLRGGRA